MTTRTVFSTMTERASHHLNDAHLALVDPGSVDLALDNANQLAARAAEHRDLTAALAHLGRTVKGRADARRPSADRLLAALEDSARPRPWTEAAPSEDPVTLKLREAARSIRAAADLWATHRSHNGQARSPEASLLRHPSMQGAALRHWKALVGQSATVAAELVRGASRADSALVEDLKNYPRPARSVVDLRPVPLPLARPGATTPSDVLEAIDDRVDRIHRHVWDLAKQQRMSSSVLINAAAIGMLLARSALHAEQHSEAWFRARPSAEFAISDPRRRPVTFVTQSDLESWAGVAAALAPVRTPDSPTTVLQIERLDLARLLERALTRRKAGDAGAALPDSLTYRLIAASHAYRQVARPCASSVRVLHDQGLLFMAGRLVPQHLIARHQSLIAARLGDRIAPAPTIVARRLEAQLHAISSAPSQEGSAA